MDRNGRQLVLVAAAVITGALLLVYALDDGDGPGFLAGQAAEPTATPTPVATELPAPTPTTVPPTATVLVANSTGVDGLAGATSAEIGDLLGHTVLTPVDSTGAALTQSAIHAEASAMAEARQIAVALGLDPTVVSVMPEAPPVADLGGAQILVVLGSDRVPSS